MRQGQSLVMAPQLQQAIKLLQLSNIELAEFVEAEIERNPLLEHGESSDRDDSDREAPERASKREELNLDDNSALNEAREAMDAPKEDLYDGGTTSDSATTANEMSGPSARTDWSQAGSGGSFSGDDYDFEGSLSSETTQHEHLHKQISMSGLSQADQLIAARLVDETDEAGYCKTDLEEVASALGADVANVEAVLEVCQGFEPVGVMARDVSECLALQLKDRDRLDPAMHALVRNLDLVAKHDIKGLCDICGVDKEDVFDMIAELRALTPRPGSAFASGTTIAVAPDVFVREMPNGMFAVELNSDTLPRVLMDKAYYAEVSALPMREREKEFISECAQNASWLIKSLDQRARTILKVASEIVRTLQACQLLPDKLLR
jgi:RNA polymerase sigma-54 factor